MTLVEKTPWRDCLMWPWRVSNEIGQYLDALAEVRTGQEAYLPALVAVSQIYLTRKPAAAWRYRTRVPTLGILLEFRATGTVWQCLRTVLLGRSDKCHSLASKF